MRTFTVGGTYDFMSGADNIIIKITGDSDERYYDTEIVGGSMVADEDLGTPKKLIKKSRVLNEWEYKRIYTREEYFTADTYGKNVRINYKDAELLDLYIEMALQTGDKRWFNQLTKAKKEVSA